MSLDVMKQALEALNKCQDWPGAYEECSRAITALRAAIEQANAGETSDGYHSFNELYAFRKAYNAALFNELAANGKCSVHKSWRHYDGELCFGGGWFIVVAMLPSGQISNHYEAKDWDLFKVPATERAMFPFDGHTGADVVARLSSYAPAHIPIEQAQEPVAWVGPSWLNPETRTWESESFAPGPINGWIPLYTTPRQWQGLTDDEIAEIAATPAAIPGRYVHSFARAIEARLKEKNA